MNTQFISEAEMPEMQNVKNRDVRSTINKVEDEMESAMLSIEKKAGEMRLKLKDDYENAYESAMKGNNQEVLNALKKIGEEIKNFNKELVTINSLFMQKNDFAISKIK